VTPQAAGRVYAMTGAEAARSGNLIIGSCVIAGRSLHVLFDSGATHSFVSESRVVELGLPVKELQYDLVVSTPASGLVKTSTVCARCKIEVEGQVQGKPHLFTLGGARCHIGNGLAICQSHSHLLQREKGVAC